MSTGLPVRALHSVHQVGYFARHLLGPALCGRRRVGARYSCIRSVGLITTEPLGFRRSRGPLSPLYCARRGSGTPCRRSLPSASHPGDTTELSEPVTASTA